MVENGKKPQKPFESIKATLLLNCDQDLNKILEEIKKKFKLDFYCSLNSVRLCQDRYSMTVDIQMKDGMGLAMLEYLTYLVKDARIFKKTIQYKKEN